MFALVDCNTFYASCEAIFRPDLWGRPIAVLSNNDGCIISVNAEAKRLGIPSFLPYFKVRDQLRRHGVQVFSSNYELYGDISRRVMTLLDDYGSSREVYSIDEAFLRLDRCDYAEHGQRIRREIHRAVGVPVCVGIAPSKTLAKLANREAKRGGEADGVCVLDEPARREALLGSCPVGEVWGVGRRLAERLAARGIHSALDLARSDPGTLRREFSVVLERTVRELGGMSCLDMERAPAARNEIVCSRSFAYKITELAELQQAMSKYVHRACEKLRAQGSLTESLLITLESVDRRRGNDIRQRHVQLPQLSNDNRLISSLAGEALAGLYHRGRRYKKCGIGLLDLRQASGAQSDLFNAGQSSPLMQALDSVNRRFGKQTLRLASSGIEQPWAMRREFKSPGYTTEWEDLPTVRC